MASTRADLIDKITGTLARRHSTAAVLFHHAVAVRLGLGPTDHKCFDLLRERGPMTGSTLATITGLTTGAITGVVARLERAGYVRREQDARDGRKQTLSAAPDQLPRLYELFGPIRTELRELLERFDTHQLAAIEEFLEATAEAAYRNAAVLRAQRLYAPGSATEKSLRGRRS
jgi:DNA-binding MarR family transcriptional regulator